MLTARAYTPQGHAILATDPADADSTPGDVYFNSTLNLLRVYADASVYGAGEYDDGTPLGDPAAASWQSLAPLSAVSSRVVGRNGVTALWVGTQAEYDAAAPHLDSTLYVIT